MFPSVVYPEDQFIHDDLEQADYIKMIDEGILIEQVPRLLFEPLIMNDSFNEENHTLITEEEAMNNSDI